MKTTKLLLSLGVLVLALVSQAQFQQDQVFKSMQFKSTAVLDIDSDGKDEIIFKHKSNESQLVSLLYHKASSDSTMFAPIHFYTFPDSLEEIVQILVDDINNDSYKDLIVVNRMGGVGSVTNEAYALFNDGSGNFINLTRIITFLNSNYFTIELEDVDADGQNDVFVKSGTNFSHWYKNNNGAFIDMGEALPITNQNYIERLDIEGDGDKDLITLYDNGAQTGVIIEENMGTYSLAPRDTFMLLTGSFTELDFFDFDDDGVREIILSNSTESIYCSFINNAYVVTDTFPPSVVFSPQFGWIEEDFDNDGDVDLIAYWGPNHSSYYFEKKQQGFPLNDGVFLTDIAFNGPFYTADLTGNGFEDVIINHFNFNSFLTNYGNGVFSPEAHPLFLSFDDYDNVSLADINGDGDLDVIAYDAYSSQNKAWVSNSNGTYEQVLIKLLDYAGNEASSSRGQIADFTNDGIADYLVGSVFIAPGNVGGTAFYEGDGSFTLNYNHSESNWPPSHTFDFNADGNLDVFYDNTYPDGEVSVGVNDGLGNFTKATTVLNPNYAMYISDINLRDINNDGYSDFSFLINQNNASDSIHVYFGNANLQFDNVQKLTPYSFDINEIYTWEDINGDGKLDLIFSERVGSGTEVKYLLQLANGTFDTNPQHLIAPNKLAGYLNVTSIRMEDINNDGFKDLFITSSGPFLGLHYFKNIGDGTFTNLISILDGLVPTQYELVDFNHDGELDIFYRRLNHEMGILLNKGAHDAYLSGNVFADYNGNGIQDIGEHGLAFTDVNSTPHGNATTTDSLGNFELFINSGLHNYELSAEKEYWNITTDTLTYHILVDSIGTVRHNLNFGLAPDSLFQLMENDITVSNARCNEIGSMWVTIRNSGTLPSSGNVRVELDSSLTYISSLPVQDSLNNQMLYYSFNGLLSGEEMKIFIDVLNPDFTSMGTYAHSAVTTDLLDNGNNIIGVFQDSLSIINSCAYDPNDKTSIPIGKGTEHYIEEADSIIEYLVRFQNTGNDTAKNVVIRDFIASELNINSFKFISSSHNMTYQIKDTREITFSFNDIYLPDSNVNYTGSQGYVKFSLNLEQGLNPGDLIENTAHIYFDQNPAVVTNTVFLTLFNCVLDTQTVSFASDYDSITCDYYGLMELPIFQPTDGVYTGVGIVNDTMFDPTGLQFGIYTINYNVDSDFGCPLTYSFDIEINECLGLEEYGVSNISVYPNPFNEVLNVVFDAELADVKVELVSSQGKVVATQEIESASSVQFNKGNLAEGVYVLRVTKNADILFTKNVAIQ